MSLLAILDQVVEIKLAVALLFSDRLGLLRRGVELGDDFIDQTIVVGELRRGLGEGIAGHRDKSLAAAIGFDGHTVSTRNLLLTVYFWAGAEPKNAQAGATRS